MNLILFDDPGFRLDLSPFTLTRPVSEIRIGIFTITEKWERYLGTQASFHTAGYLAEKYPVKNTGDNLLVNGAVCPDKQLAKAITGLKKEEAISKNGILVAARTQSTSFDNVKVVEFENDITLIDQVWKIFQYNG